MNDASAFSLETHIGNSEYRVHTLAHEFPQRSLSPPGVDVTPPGSYRSCSQAQGGLDGIPSVTYGTFEVSPFTPVLSLSPLNGAPLTRFRRAANL